jgi:hypothetical protein
VVCSRLEEYNFCKTQLDQLNGAVCLQPLTDDQIRDYLTDVKRPKLWQSIQTDSVLKELAASPFLLTIMAVAYEETTIQQPHNSDPEACRQFYLNCLFNAYIQKQLNYLIKSKSYPKNKPDAKETMRWLKLLAKQMKKDSLTELLIENIQPSWLKSYRHKILYQIGSVLIFCLILCLIYGLMFDIIVGLHISIILILILIILRPSEAIYPVENMRWSWL